MSVTEGLDAEPPSTCSDELRLIGRFRLLRDGHEVAVPIGGQRVLALLGLGGPSTRAVTAGTLWPDATEERSHGSLRTALWRLHGVWPGLVAVRDGQVGLHPGLRVDIGCLVDRALTVLQSPAPSDDGEREGAARGDGRRGDADGTSDGHFGAGGPRPPAGRPGAVASAIGHLRALTVGELLPGWDDDWVAFERERFRQLRMHALEELSVRLAGDGCYALALDAALQAVQIEPLRESAHHAVITIHLAEGNVVEARRHYETFRRSLHQELGVEPTPRLRALLAPAGTAADGRLPGWAVAAHAG